MAAVGSCLVAGGIFHAGTKQRNRVGLAGIRLAKKVGMGSGDDTFVF